MVSLAAYKAALAILLVLSAASTGSITYYFQQKTSDLNNQITDLNTEVSSSRSQVSNLNSNLDSLISQISYFQSLNSQLQSQIDELQSQIEDLTVRLPAYNTTLVSSGILSLGGGTPLFVSFTVPSTTSSWKVNLTAYMSATPGGNQAQYFTVALLNQTEYELFQPWSDSPRTWASPHVDSITALVDVPFPGDWYLAFENQVGVGSEQNVTYSVSLTKVTIPIASLTTRTTLVSQGQISLTGNGAVAYINFTLPFNTVSATLNVSFTGVEFGVTTRLSLLSEEQYQVFNTCNCIYYGNYSSISTTWSSPMAHSYTAQVEVPYSGKWVLAFQHAPGSGSTETFDEKILLISILQS